MKLLRRYVILSFFLLLVFSSVMPALAQGEKKKEN